MTMPSRLRVVGDHERPDHYHLPQGTNCYFWGEYTPFEHTDGKNWNFSPTNQLICNFKKKVDRRAYPDWQYKLQATERIAQAFSKFWKWPELHEQYHVALIPVPPSRPRGDPAYDPRMLDMLNAISRRAGRQLDIRDCLSFSGRYDASHEVAERPTPAQLLAELSFDAMAGRSAQPPGAIFLFDDMLTTGAHYVAAADRLTQHFPGVQIIGNFVARRIVPNPFEDLTDLDDL